MDVVKDVLIDEDASLVERIPLSQKTSLDRLIWKDSIAWILTIKSAYYVARRLLGFEDVDRNVRSVLWKRVWTAKVAPKVKALFWKMIQSCIHKKSNLIGK